MRPYSLTRPALSAQAPGASFENSYAADVTMSAIPVAIENASSFGIISARSVGTIDAFSEKPTVPRPMPDDPRRALASMGNYVFRPAALATLLEQAARSGGTDFGRDVLAASASTGTARSPTTSRTTQCPACVTTKSRPTGATSGPFAPSPSHAAMLQGRARDWIFATPYGRFDATS